MPATSTGPTTFTGTPPPRTTRCGTHLCLTRPALHLPPSATLHLALIPQACQPRKSKQAPRPCAARRQKSSPEPAMPYCGWLMQCTSWPRDCCRTARARGQPPGGAAPWRLGPHAQPAALRGLRHVGRRYARDCPARPPDSRRTQTRSSLDRSVLCVFRHCLGAQGGLTSRRYTGCSPRSVLTCVTRPRVSSSASERFPGVDGACLD